MVSRSILLIVALGLPQTAQADGGDAIYIEQVSLDNTFGHLNVVIPEDGEGDASASLKAGGNDAFGQAAYGRMMMSVDQNQYGAAIATAQIEGGSTAGAVSAITESHGNRADASNLSGSTQYLAYQTNDGYTQATTNVNIHTSRTLDARTTAVANASAHSTTFGDNRGYSEQTANGDVLADARVQACCVSETVDVDTAAAGNAMVATGDTSTLVAGAVQITADGAAIRGRTSTFLGRALDVSVATSAAGNSAEAINSHGYALLGREGSEVFQGNVADVSAETSATVQQLYGEAAISANGVGNTLSLSNVGADTDLQSIQSNYGDVSATASLEGISGSGVGTLEAIAVGNDATAMLCDVCGTATLSGTIQQANFGQVQARSEVTGETGDISAATTVFGNRASFIVGD